MNNQYGGYGNNQNNYYGQQPNNNYNQDPNNNYYGQQPNNNWNPVIKTSSSAVTALSFLALVSLAIGVILYISNSSEIMFINMQMTFNTLTQFALLGAGVVFFIYYFVCYKNDGGKMLEPLTFGLLGATGLIGVINVIFSVVEANSKGGDIGKAFLSVLPALTVPAISAILFFLVAKNFITNSFSKVTYTMALGFVLAACPQSVIQYLVALMNNTSGGQTTAILFAFLIAIGQAFLYTALIVHGVREYYAE